MLRKAKVVVAAAGVAVAAGTLPILAASPASATQAACTNYVATHGYFAGPKVKAACGHKAIDTGVSKVANPACILGLAELDVPGSVSQPACKRA
ncbi:hypothetical protein Stsp02_12970 [Streptomyces sp. NBRC 14336]|uniref:hypothetical protein n=1 Tax=Streptomyces sp. NBRC 14336 TaxID=3030992 RepID=UPI0024A0F470|nr:hypothetical protein [Streptomyces sp. NBRC 14336]WBO77999.1 hypothetical protein SBE_001565 [Streptomyces sp. SBE_14.2]GLW45635.1 hypothetical protein Stsp02_12970 [Streptomyces sp. NBRC 14336]